MMKCKCPLCRTTIEAEESLTGKQATCAACGEMILVPLSKREIAERDRVPREQGIALAKHQFNTATKKTIAVFYGMIYVAIAVGVLIFWWMGLAKRIPLSWVVLVLVSIVVIPTVITFLARVPWYVVSKRATIRAAEKWNREKEETDRKNCEADRKNREAEELERKLEEDRRKRQEQEEQARHKAEEDRELRRADGGSEECWRHLGWWDFEIAVLLMFEHIGLQAKATAPSADAGLDGILSCDGEEAAGVQCKHFVADQYVGVGEIRDFIGALVTSRLKKGYFVTTGKYSDHAMNLVANPADGPTVELLDLKDLRKLGEGLKLTSEVISAAKDKWNVPQDPPPEMPQGPRQRRRYNTFRGRKWFRRRW
jgi:restriction endonuclease Mrr